MSENTNPFKKEGKLPSQWDLWLKAFLLSLQHVLVQSPPSGMPETCSLRACTPEPAGLSPAPASLVTGTTVTSELAAFFFFFL